MIESRTANRIPGLEINPTAWMSAYCQSWTLFEEWNKFWTQQWKEWFDVATSMPNPWLPTLSANRSADPLGIELFFPWLPRIEAFVTPMESDGDRDAMRVRLRAAMSNTMTGEQAGWLNVDATVSRSGTPAPRTVEEVRPPEITAPSEQVIDAPVEQAEGSAAAPKPRTRRTRAAGAPRTNKPGTGE